MVVKKCTNCGNFVAERCETSIPCKGGIQWTQKETEDITNDVVYLCDNMACLHSCSKNECKHTKDITHAKNFKEVAPHKYMEIEYLFPQLNYMQLWLYNWLMLDKEYSLERIASMSNEEFGAEVTKFIEMYDGISKGEIK